MVVVEIVVVVVIVALVATVVVDGDGDRGCGCGCGFDRDLLSGCECVDVEECGRRCRCEWGREYGWVMELVDETAARGCGWEMG